MTEGLIVASNRGPARWARDEEGNRTAKRGFGGLVTALGDALAEEPGQWVSVALDDDDIAVARDHGEQPLTVELAGSPTTVRLLDVGDRFADYYDVVSNQLLWFTLHQLWNAPYEPTSADWRAPWEGSYLPVNERVGAAVAEAAQGDVDVLLQDYHLCAAPAVVRRERPEVPLLQYLHTPWVGPELMERLPDAVAHGVLEGLLAADVVAFSSQRWCERFRECAESYGLARRDGDTLLVGDRRVRVSPFTLGVDADGLAASAASAAVIAAGERLDALRDGRAMIARAERTDLSKNVLRGLLAYERLLTDEPGLADRVWHYANLNPSRQGVPAYRAYLEACQEVADRIRERFGERALTLDVGDDYPAVLAALQRYDVLLTNSVADGTNLVAKEGPTLNTADGVLVLSRTTGAVDVLGEAALTVNPFDVAETTAALRRALAMDAQERRARATALREASAQGAPADWLAAQRRTLREAAATRWS